MRTPCDGRMDRRAKIFDAISLRVRAGPYYQIARQRSRRSRLFTLTPVEGSVFQTSNVHNWRIRALAVFHTRGSARLNDQEEIAKNYKK